MMEQQKRIPGIQTVCGSALHKMSSNERSVEMTSKTAQKSDFQAIRRGKNIDNKTRLQNWTSYCVQMIHNQSLRSVQYAFQMTTTFVFTALIAYKSPYSRSVAVPYMMTFMAPMLIQDTFAGTVQSARGCIVNYVPACIFIYILQVLGMGYHNYVSTTITFLIVCFWMGYVNPTIAPRKTALLLPAILFTSLMTTPRANMTDNFVWKVLELNIVALTINIAVSLLFFPRFAAVEAQERFSYSLSRSKEVLELVIDAVMSTHRSSAEVFLCEAESIITNISANQEILSARATLSEYEPEYWVRRLLRGKQSAYNKYTLPELVQLSADITWHMTSMIHATRNINFNEYHAVACDASRETFRITVHRYQTLIDKLHRRVHDPVEINIAVLDLTTACDHMYAVLSQSLKLADRTSEGAESGKKGHSPFGKQPSKPSGTKLVGAGDHHNQQHNKNKFHDFYSSDDIHLGPSSPPHPGGPSRAYSDSHSPSNYDIDAKKGANRLTFGFCLFHFSELVQLVDSHFTTTTMHNLPQTRHRTVTLTSFSASVKQAVQAAPPLTVRTFPAIVYGRIREVVMSWGEDWETKTKVGIRTAVLMGIGLIFVEVPRLTEQFENGQWILYGVVMSQGDNLGGTLYTSRNRLFGTLFGAIFGYFVYISVGTDIYSIIGMYVPFLLICGVIKQYQQWSYFGQVACFTGLIVSLGRVTFEDDPVGDYSLLRIQQNVIGILIGLGFTLLTMHVHAVDLLKINIIEVLDKLSSSTCKVLEVYRTTVNSVHFDGETAVQAAVDALAAQGIQVAPRAPSSSSSVSSSNRSRSQSLVDTITSSFRVRTSSNSNDAPTVTLQTDRVPFQPSSVASGSTKVIDTSIAASGIAPVDYDALETNNFGEFSIDVDELLVVENNKKIQLVKYIGAEGTLIKTKVSQQPLLIDQALIENVFWAKPFPEETYNRLITCQKRIVHMMVTIDRALLRISKITQLKVVESSLQFGQKVSGEVSILLTQVTSNLQRWKLQMQSTVNCDIDFKVDDLKAVSEALLDIDSREKHCKGLEKMHRAALNLAENSLKFNNEMMKGSLSSILQKEQEESVAIGGEITSLAGTAELRYGLDELHIQSDKIPLHSHVAQFTADGYIAHTLSSDGMDALTDHVYHRTMSMKDIINTSTDANIHHLFDILTTFNALFYASSHLATATMDLGNVLYTILLLEKKVTHKEF